MHTALIHSEPSKTSKIKPFANVAEYYCLVLKLTVKSKGLVKKDGNMIIRHFKANILPAQNESGCHI